MPAGSSRRRRGKTHPHRNARANPRHGDFASNLAMVLGKQGRMQSAHTRRAIGGRVAVIGIGRKGGDRRPRLHQFFRVGCRLPGSHNRHPTGRRKIRVQHPRCRAESSWSNSSRQTPPARCTSGTAAARLMAMRLPECWRRPATRFSVNTMSTTLAGRSTS